MLKEILHERRSYRSFVPVEISDKVVHDLAYSAGLSASCFNNQPWNFIFVRDRDRLKLLFDAMSRGNEWTFDASMIIAVISRAEDDCKIHGRVYNLFDTGMATAYMMLRAWDLGLVAHAIGGYHENEVKEALNIPDDMQVITLLIVGKHTELPSRRLSEKQLHDEGHRPPRKSFEKYCFIDSYQKDQ